MWVVPYAKLDTETVGKLKHGLSANEVRDLIGPPEVVAPTGNGGEIWSYLFTTSLSSRALAAIRQGLFDWEPRHTLLTIRLLDDCVVEIMANPDHDEHPPRSLDTSSSGF